MRVPSCCNINVTFTPRDRTGLHVCTLVLDYNRTGVVLGVTWGKLGVYTLSYLMYEIPYIAYPWIQTKQTKATPIEGVLFSMSHMSYKCLILYISYNL